MADDSDPLYQLDRKIERTGDDIKSRLLVLEENSVKKENLKEHYATKFFCGTIVITVSIALCAAYIFVTPLLIDSKNSMLNKNIDKILDALAPKKK